MEQHPIPQNISSYQFRLVGDMTLKQFFQLAGGIVVGLIFYSSPLLGIIKWPLAIVSVILGVAMAFMPLEGRPLERWIIAFFRAIYSPTLFSWQKASGPTKFFQDEPTTPAPEIAIPTQKGSPTPFDRLEQAERGFLSALTNVFSGVGQPSQPYSTPQGGAPRGEPGLKFPEVQPVKITQEGKPKIVVEERKVEIPIGSSITTSQVAPTIVGEEMVSTHAAIFSVDAAPPNPPTSPNVVVGQVVDQDRKIVEGAIMEIRDSSGRPIRALKSNKLGHFIIVTPLDKGRYDIITEKDAFEFSPVSFEATGEIIPPILVSGRRLYDQNPIPVSS